MSVALPPSCMGLADGRSGEGLIGRGRPEPTLRLQAVWEFSLCRRIPAPSPAAAGSRTRSVNCTSI